MGRYCKIFYQFYTCKFVERNSIRRGKAIHRYRLSRTIGTTLFCPEHLPYGLFSSLSASGKQEAPFPGLLFQGCLLWGFHTPNSDLAGGPLELLWDSTGRLNWPFCMSGLWVPHGGCWTIVHSTWRKEAENPPQIHFCSIALRFLLVTELPAHFLSPTIFTLDTAGMRTVPLSVSEMTSRTVPNHRPGASSLDPSAEWTSPCLWALVTTFCFAFCLLPARTKDAPGTEDCGMEWRDCRTWKQIDSKINPPGVQT